MGLNDLNDYSNSLVRDSLKSSLYHAASVNPDEFAERQTFGKKNNIPTSLVPSDKGRRNEIELLSSHSNLHETHPRTAAWLSNMDNASVAHDDIQNLSYIERLFSKQNAKAYWDSLHSATKPPEDVVDFVTRVIPESGVKFAVGAAEFPYHLTKSFTDAGIEDTKHLLSADGSPMPHGIAKAVGENIKGFAQFSGEPLGVYGLDKAKEKWTTDPVGSVAGILPFLGGLVELSKASKVRTRSPEQFKEHVKAAADGIENLTMPVKSFEALLAKSDLTAAQVLTDPANYHEAKGGGSVSIPVEDFATNLAEHVTPDDLKEMRVGLADSVNEAAGKAEEKPAPVELRPAVKVGEELKVGEPGQRHTDIVPDTPEETRVFTLDGKTMLSREEAASWLKENHPDLYEKLPEDQKKALHSEGLWESQGVEVPTERGELPIGPGAATKGAKEAGTDIEQLRKAIPKGKVEKPSTLGQIVADAFDTVGLVKEKSKAAFEAVKDIGQKIWDGYKHRAAGTNYEDLFGEYLLDRQKSGMKVAQFVKEIQDNIHPRVQEAITNWIEAGGNSDILAERAKAEGPHQQGYVDALHLDEAHINFAENIRNYFDSRLEQAIDAGVVSQGVENYIHRIWDRGSKIGKTVSSEASSGLLQANPKLAKQRVFQSFFEGEQLGYKPKDKRVGYLLSAYELSLNEAIATRALIKSLRDGVASDGQPLVVTSGSGVPVESHEYIVGREGETGKVYKTKTAAEQAKKPGQVISERSKDSFIVKPKTKGTEGIDYRPIDHPALRGWKWIGNVEGKNVLVQGDFLVHPEIYKHLYNNLSESKVKAFEIGGYRPGALILAASQELKSTLLTASFFHQGQEALHGIGHKVSPFGGKGIDLNDPVQASLVKHGLMAYSHNAMAAFSDGLHASGLVSKIPGIGRYAVQYGNYLFGKYIPELKMQMALDALERNRERYSSKLNESQILKLTAEQANAAFGEMNYAAMGRSKTKQDLLRLAVLAPDFLEARAKFVGQALKPHGREQLAALVRLSVGLALTAQITNELVNGEPDWKHPFSIKIHDKMYTLPSVPGDIIHFVTDTRGFAYNRLSPSFAKPVIESLTGRDGMGRRKELGTRLHEWLIAQSPIPLQETLKGHDTDFIDFVLKMFGTRVQKKR